MPRPHPLGIDDTVAPFDRFTHIRWLAPARSGRDPGDDVRHQLYAGRERYNPVNVLIKVTSKAGLVYERDLANEISSLETINRELPDSHFFPFVHEHGRLADGRLYLVMSLFDEFPLATMIAEERAPDQLVTHLRIGIEMARAISDIHGLGIFHVDLNPMNVLCHASNDRPIIRIVDFESSYERGRHTPGDVYNPPTTPGYSAPKRPRQAPDARVDIYSLGAVLYSLLAAYRWTPGVPIETVVDEDRFLDAELKSALLGALDPSAGKRYRSVKQFQSALGTYLERIWPGRVW